MKFNPYAEVVLAALIWGSSGVLVKYAQLPPAVFSFFRMAIPTLLLFVFFSFNGTKLFRGNDRLIIFASSLNAVRIFFYFAGFTYTSIGNAVIVLYTWPIFATGLSILFLKEEISGRNLVLLLTAFSGIILVYVNQEITFANRDFVGMSAMLLSAFVYACTIIIFKRESPRYSRWETVFYQNFIGAFVFLPVLFINREGLNLGQVSLAGTHAILIGLLGFGLFFSALRYIKASAASFLSYFEVVSAVIFGIVLFEEVLTLNMIIGGILIIASSLLLKK